MVINVDGFPAIVCVNHTESRVRAIVCAGDSYATGADDATVRIWQVTHQDPSQ